MHEQFELLPGEGVVMPRDAGVLRFGMSEREAQWVVAALCDVRETWVCGARWAFGAVLHDIGLLVCGAIEGPLRGRAESILFERLGVRPERPSGVPVVLDGVDLFGYPGEEVAEALGASVVPGVRLDRGTGRRDGVRRAPGYLRGVSLSAWASGGLR
ncbi:hypothetical protein [Streptomyces sp. NPDC059828]|uniref:hypothetical protein n=1 Tax=Streptomyces sp. NPDC059828 TaxID=3346965 RepID=UPI0036469419